MTAQPAALPVLAAAIDVVVSEVGFNTAADARFIVKQLDAAGFDIVARPPASGLDLDEIRIDVLVATTEPDDSADCMAGDRMFDALDRVTGVHVPALIAECGRLAARLAAVDASRLAARSETP
ncbi:hypothetical protein OG216_09845 [Streptomycetaceae bacterium NBC_01309]